MDKIWRGWGGGKGGIKHHWRGLKNSTIVQEAQGPWLAYLSDTATADMQLLCNIFFSNPIIATNVGNWLSDF